MHASKERLLRGRGRKDTGTNTFCRCSARPQGPLAYATLVLENKKTAAPRASTASQHWVGSTLLTLQEVRITRSCPSREQETQACIGRLVMSWACASEVVHRPETPWMQNPPNKRRPVPDLPCYPPLPHGSSRFAVDDRRKSSPSVGVPLLLCVARPSAARVCFFPLSIFCCLFLVVNMYFNLDLEL